MEAKSRVKIQELGDSTSKKLFVWFDAGVHKRFPKGKQDDTHLNASGATFIAQLAVDGIRELKLPLEKELLPYDLLAVDAPFSMPLIRVFRFPQKDFPITKYGAQSGGKFDNTKVFAKAILECNKAGGGRVVVPAGEWLTGPIHFLSNVNLYLEEGAVLLFSDNPSDYLPAVMTSWEGMECYNYSPLLYAFNCENIAITGRGMLKPKMETWRTWFKRPQPHLDALKKLYDMASFDVPVEKRQMAKDENNLRPHLIHFNRCRNVLLDSFKIRESPFWTIHIYMCENGVARNLDVRAHGHNNDGIDLEMTKDFLVENCTFDQGDDAVVIKAGRNRDAWRLNTPTENIVVRNCTILKGHALLAVGSEISGGIRNVYMHDCTAPNNVNRFFFIKTNHRRGGFIENIYMENVHSGTTKCLFEIDTDVLYQWKDLVPTYETRITRINNIVLKNVTCDSTNVVYELKGDARLPISNVEINNVKIGKVLHYFKRVKNTENLVEINDNSK
ncbi:polygalacturonase [Bacteroides reticulotermitis JCM 10512]|uniref:Polygalacturonase n=2 Tax=Bacteroides reticulotermitis TaxID=1133319 RepID=W4UVT7_9BACE|nr:polygalacturonase [Bacteroides reticulotermitis JCM 10512]